MDLIQFPGLWGLKFEIRRWVFEVFGLPIYWYGIIIALGFLLAVLLGIRACEKFGFIPDNILDLVLFAAPVAIVSARLYYVIFSWDLFKDNPIKVFDTREGGLAIYGAVIGAFLVAYIYARVKKLNFLKLADFCAPYVIMAQAIGRWGNFVNQEAFGSKTMLPWRMNGYEPNKYLNNLGENLDLSKWGVHPTFLYESLWNIAAFAFLIWFRKRKKLDGEVISLYLVFYGLGRFFIESLRTDSLMLGGTGIRVSQLLSAVFVIVFAILFILRRMKKKKLAESEEIVEIGQSKYGSILMKLKEEEVEAEVEAENTKQTDKSDQGDKTPGE